VDEHKSHKKELLYPIVDHLEVIKKCFAKDSLEGVMQALLDDAGMFALKCLQRMKAASPVSLAVIFSLMKRAPNRTLEENLQAEFRAMQYILSQNDLYEGIQKKILLTDSQDEAPQWQYKQVSEVPVNVVEEAVNYVDSYVLTLTPSSGESLKEAVKKKVILLEAEPTHYSISKADFIEFQTKGGWEVTEENDDEIIMERYPEDDYPFDIVRKVAEEVVEDDQPEVLDPDAGILKDSDGLPILDEEEKFP